MSKTVLPSVSDFTQAFALLMANLSYHITSPSYVSLPSDIFLEAEKRWSTGLLRKTEHWVRVRIRIIKPKEGKIFRLTEFDIASNSLKAKKCYVHMVSTLRVLAMFSKTLPENPVEDLTDSRVDWEITYPKDLDSLLETYDYYAKKWGYSQLFTQNGKVIYVKTR